MFGSLFRPLTFAALLRALCVESLCINRSIFEDAQIISDDLFIKNSQLISIKMTSPDGEWQSFPLLTDRTLSHWAKGRYPKTLQMNHIETSFTIQGVKEMLQKYVIIVFHINLCLYF
uniref:Secreted protein n=1 Tax=Heterorhabditis bacteriophora TaxID=37862 RepID=A0A1I7X0Y2_HETBA